MLRAYLYYLFHINCHCEIECLIMSKHFLINDYLYSKDEKGFSHLKPILLNFVE